MFLSAWLTSKPTDRAGSRDGGGTGGATAAIAAVRATRIRDRAGRQDDSSALRRTKRRRKGDVSASGPGSGSGSGSGSGPEPGGNTAAQPRVKISIPKAGGYDKLQLVEFGSGATSGPNLTPEDEDSLIVVATSFVGINYADICVRWGLYASAKKFVGWPITPGFEFSGVVESVGPAVTDLKPGDAVFGASMFGSYSTHVQVPRRQVFPLPAFLKPSIAAGLPCVAMTAYYAMFEEARLRPGHNVLVHSAAGGVGTMLCQMGKIIGCKVVGVVGRGHKVKYALAHGCDHVIDKSTQDLWALASEFAPEGYHAVFDANGVSTLKQSFAHLAPTGRLVVYGFHSMLPRRGGVLGVKEWAKMAVDYVRTPRFNPLDMTATNRCVMAFNLSFLFNEHELLRECMENIVTWIEEGKLKPAPVRVYAFSDVASAHRDIESGNTVGKLVLDSAQIHVCGVKET